MTRKERLVKEATEEILSKVVPVVPNQLQEVERDVRKLLRRLYEDGYDDGDRACRRVLDSYYYARR